MFMLDTTIKYDYDIDEDILYLSIGEPKPAITQEIEEGILIRKDIKTGEIVGVTIIDYKDRLNKKEKINIPKVFDLAKIKI
ncbi:MAG: DUF2283 domain-containing protein [Clostridia bacterium]|nr:DUF2283 domain-containing protein [Clostridia bacterium]